MRVIAGDFKGRRLTAPKGSDVRPTADRVKEAIFSMVQYSLTDSVCLDLFAGSGSLGIEALSRGAKRVYFCDIDADSVALIRQNLHDCGVDNSRAAVFRSDWRCAYRNIDEKCNLVLIDAPYDKCVYYSQILEALIKQGILIDSSFIVIERDAKTGGYELPAGYEIMREKCYGSVSVDLLLYTKSETEND